MNSKQLTEFYAWMRHTGENNFDSREKAAQYWLDNLAPSKMRRMLQDRADSRAISQGPAGDPMLTAELLRSAIENGEYFYLLWTPDGEGGAFFDMQLVGGDRFSDVLVGYALDMNAHDDVNKFMRIVETQFARARNRIEKEIARRSQQN